MVRYGAEGYSVILTRLPRFSRILFFLETSVGCFTYPARDSDDVLEVCAVEACYGYCRSIVEPRWPY
jgi:hypothetical protein